MASREVPLSTYEHFADRDQLGEVVLERMLAGVSTRQYRRAQEPVGEQVEAGARSTSKSAASRMFVQRTRDELWRLMNRPLSDLRLAVIMLDGIELHGVHQYRRAGDHHRGREARARAVGGVDRERDRCRGALVRSGRPGLDVEQGLLFVIDGSKALRKAITAGVRQRRAGAALLLSTSRETCLTSSPSATARPSRPGCARAWKDTDYRPRARAAQLPSRPSSTTPTRAPPRSLREGMEETLTVTRLGITGKLKLTPAVDQPVRVDGAPRGAM